MSTIGPGTILICVDASGPSNPTMKKNGESSSLTTGALYRAQRFKEQSTYCARDYCGLPSVKVHGNDLFFCQNRFKPFIDGLEIPTEVEEKEPTHA